MSKEIILPSGKVATRFFHGGELHWQLPTNGTADWVTLDLADIAALAAAAGLEIVDWAATSAPKKGRPR